MKNIQEENYNTDTDTSIIGISRKTIKDIIRIWHELGLDQTELKSTITPADKPFLINEIRECIKQEGGEVTRRAKIVHIAMIYIHLSKKGKESFFKILASHFDVDIKKLDEKIQLLKSAKSEKDKINRELLLRDALVPPRVKLFKQLITLPNGFIFLKDMRSDLLPLVKTDLRLKKLCDDIKTLLVTYFDVNLLDLVEITWNSPATLLERLMEYEAVHDIVSWRDLKHRLYTDHRVFAFFHNRMPNDPLIFVEVALVKGMSNNIQKLINVKVKPEDPYQADTAIFYSISNTQKGLEGISFGNFLIKRVVKKLSADFPNLKEFATLSPIPLFINWLTAYLQNGGDNYFSASEKKQICCLAESKDANDGLLKILNANKWHKNPDSIDILKKPLMRLCAHYLFNFKRHHTQNAYDPVANFHLSNGAKIEHIHWMADISKRGIARSAGIMLNYHYRLDKININHEAYMTSGKIHASSDARSWLNGNNSAS